MSKYKNISKYRLFIPCAGNLIDLHPNSVAEFPQIPSDEFLKFLEKLEEPKQKKALSVEIEEHQKSDLPEDFYVVIDDAVVEELKAEVEPKRKTKRRTRKT
jgi:hypothetical protein